MAKNLNSPRKIILPEFRIVRQKVVWCNFYDPTPTRTERGISFIVVRLYIRDVNCFPFLTLVCLIQMLWNLYTMLITTKHISRVNFGGVTFTVLELCPFTKEKMLNFSFPFSDFSLHQPNVLKLNHNAYYHKKKKNTDQVRVLNAPLQMEKLLNVRFRSLIHNTHPFLILHLEYFLKRNQ